MAHSCFSFVMFASFVSINSDAIDDAIDDETDPAILKSMAEQLEKWAEVLTDAAKWARRKPRSMAKDAKRAAARAKFEDAVKKLELHEAVATLNDDWAHEVMLEDEEGKDIAESTLYYFIVDVRLLNIESDTKYDSDGDARLSRVGNSYDELKVAKLPTEAKPCRKAITDAITKLMDDVDLKDVYKVAHDTNVDYDSDRDHHRCWVDIGVDVYVVVKVGEKAP